MDFAAGFPILVASFIAVLVLSWLMVQRRWLEASLPSHAGCSKATIMQPVSFTCACVRRVALSATLAAPLVMLFSGQLDAHGIADAFDGALQIIAPLTSACFSAAVMWLLIASVLVVHGCHCRILESFKSGRQRRELW